jgi:cysteine desulfurase/selenocysteine lyase
MSDTKKIDNIVEQIMSLNTNQIKKDFPILQRKVNGKRLVYLDNAATSQRPKQVIEAVDDFYRRHNANVHRGLHVLSEEASEMYEEARRVVAGFVGADKQELVFVRNATEGFNLIAFAWGLRNLKKGDRVVTTIMEHHSNMLPWQMVCQATGAELRIVGVTDEGVLDRKDLERKLNKKTKLVTVGHMSNTTGTINPVEEITKMAKRVGARVMIDAAQSVQHLGLDVRRVGGDFMAFSGHKMLAPMGIGGLYIKKERQEEMGPFMSGGGMIAEVYTDKSPVWAKGVEKFEAGTPNVAGAIGLAAAVKYHQRLGMDNIREHEKKLTEYALGRLEKVGGLKLVGPREVEIRGGVVTWVMDGIHAHDVAQVLDSEGVAVRSGHHCTMPLHQRLGLTATTRASFYVYNDKDDVDRLVEGLEKVRSVFG